MDYFFYFLLNIPFYPYFGTSINSEDPPIVEDQNDAQGKTSKEAWTNSNFLCKNYIINGLDDTFSPVYSKKK